MEPPAYTRAGVAAAVASAAFLGLIVGASLNANDLPNPKEWQTLIAASVAVIAAWIAWTNVKKQLAMQREALRINLMSREEDRMEEQLPGLKDAVILLGRLRVPTQFGRPALGQIKATVSEAGIAPADNVDERLERLLPRTDYETRKLVGSVVTLLRYQAALLEAAQSMLREAERGNDPKEIESALASVRLIEGDAVNAIDSVQKLSETFRLRIESKQQRIPRFRRQIEAFFAER
jgi:hypothetical protein